MKAKNSAKRKNSGIFLPALFLAMCLGGSACGVSDSAEPAAMLAYSFEAPSPEPTASSTPRPTPSPTPVPTPEPFEEYDITLMALGDNLMHMGVVYTGKQNDGSYDYTFLFENMTDFLSRADIKIINQETIFGGNERGFSGFPHFNSPTQVGDAIAEAGFNVVLHATNHAADQEYSGIQNCVRFWQQYPEILMTGISGDEPAERIPLLTVGDVTFAVLNYTYGPNMGTLDSSLRGHLNMLCDYNTKTGLIDFTTLNPQVLQDIQDAKKLSDIVIVCPHWGTEYTTAPSSYQIDFARQMSEAGADLILGTHPHVPQPVEWITSEDGQETLCYYSLGNYVSTQKEAICMLEEMAWVSFHVTEDGVSINRQESGVLPLVCHYKSGPVRLVGVYPLEDYTEEQASAHGIWQYGGVALHLEYLEARSQELFGDMILRKQDILPQ